MRRVREIEKSQRSGKPRFWEEGELFLGKERTLREHAVLFFLLFSSFGCMLSGAALSSRLQDQGAILAVLISCGFIFMMAGVAYDFALTKARKGGGEARSSLAFSLFVGFVSAMIAKIFYMK